MYKNNAQLKYNDHCQVSSESRNTVSYDETQSISFTIARTVLEEIFSSYRMEC